MAQNVYSLNVVGYYNITVPAGLSLHANQLNVGTNGIQQVIPTAADGSLVLTFVNNDYNVDYMNAGTWVDNGTFETSTTTLPPGKGWFFNNAGASGTMTLVGEVPQGPALPVNLPSGLALVGTYTPQALELTPAASGFNATSDGTLHLRFDTGLQDYVISYWNAGGWVDNGTFEPVTVIPGVGDGYFINNAGASTIWTRNFTVQ